MKDFGLKKNWEKFVFHFISRNFKILISENVDFSGRQAGRKSSMSESQRVPSNWEKGKLELFSAIGKQVATFFDNKTRFYWTSFYFL